MSIPAIQTKHGRTTQKYEAEFCDVKAIPGLRQRIRFFWAVNKFQADKIVDGILKKNPSWVRVKVGLA